MYNKEGIAKFFAGELSHIGVLDQLSHENLIEDDVQRPSHIDPLKLLADWGDVCKCEWNQISKDMDELFL